MDRDEAKAILELHRPGSADDAQDPVIAEALSLLETDAELNAWFAEQQALDARISESYNGMEPPSDLKASILAGMRAHALQHQGDTPSADFIPSSHDKMDASTTSRAWWRNPWAGLAAVFAVLLAISAIPRGDQSTQLSSNATQVAQAGIPPMVEFLSGEIDALIRKERSFEKRSEEPQTLQAYLANAGAPSPAALPKSVSGKNSIGCITFDHDGMKMSMICFKEDRVIHLTTVKKTDCMNQISEAPTIYEINNQAFRVWVEGDQVHILSVHGGKDNLPDFI
jgi:hypothetical protein